MTLEKRAIVTPVEPVSAEIFYEDGIPYIKYKGTARLSDGFKVLVEIHKLSLTLSAINCAAEGQYHTAGAVSVLSAIKREFFATTDDVAMIIKPISRTCSKADLEKELGYKLIFTE